MGTAPVSKSELLAAAQALLDHDDQERANTLRRSRHDGLWFAILIASLILLGLAALLAARHNRTSAAPGQAPATASQGVQ
jgi:hypothetical protein